MTKLKPGVDLGYPTEAHGRIPSFSNIEEEAEFWDTHDASEFYGSELRPTGIAAGPELITRLTLRLEETDRTELARQARLKGIGPSTLVRIWIKERLNEERKAAD